MADKLQVDLVAGNAVPATAAVEKFTAALVKSDTTAKSLEGGKNFAAGFDKQIATIERQALNLGFTLRKIAEVSVNPKGVDGLGKAAQRADADLRIAYARLRQIEQQAATTADPVLFKKLRLEAEKTGLDLDALQNKINRVAAGRQAAAARRGPGSNIDGRGLLNSAAGLGIPGAFEASAGLDAAAAIGISTAGLAVFGAIAAAGVGLVKLSEHLRDEAKKRLGYEEAIAIAVNKQILAGKEVLTNFAKAREEAQFQRDFQRDLVRLTAEELEHRRALQEFFLKANPTGENADRQKGVISKIDAQLDRLKQQKQAQVDNAFNQRNENFKRAQREQAEFERKRLESINAGRAKIDELGKSTDEFFARLFVLKGANNPFVAVFTEAADAIEQTRLATALLSKDLQKQAADMVAAQNANALFSARLDTALKSNDLRQDARAFRNAGSVFDTARADLLARTAIEKFQRETAAGLFRNPDRLAIFGPGASNKTQLDLFNFRRQQDEAGGIFRNPIFDEERRRQLSAADPSSELTAQDRLDKQLAIIRGLKPENEFQRAEADRKIIALTQGLNPADLSDAQRNAAAAARENEAARLDNAETAAKAERADNAAIQKSIDKNIADLLKIAKSEGLTGVIRIINEAEDSAKESLGKRKRADALDARDLMD